MEHDDYRAPDGWRVVRRVFAPGGREAVTFVADAAGHVKFAFETWQLCYDRSAADLTAPVEGGV